MTAVDEDDGPLADHPADAGGAGPELTYPGAPDSVIARWNLRRHPVTYRHGDALPPLDTDLAALASQIIPHDLPALTERLPPYRRKLYKLRMQLPGQPELAALNAILIVNLRRSAYPDHAPALFLRIWREHGDSLMRQLSGRWLISSIITFGDVGETEAQRRIGLSMNVLFSMIKLYEAERAYSGYRSDKVFDQPMARRSPLPVGMQSFSLSERGAGLQSACADLEGSVGRAGRRAPGLSPARASERRPEQHLPPDSAHEQNSPGSGEPGDRG